MSKLALVLEIILPLLKKKTRKDYHSKFGTFTCEYGKEDIPFTGTFIQTVSIKTNLLLPFGLKERKPNQIKYFLKNRMG